MSEARSMSIYEPAMCCETGLCGSSIDPELLRVSTTIDRLRKQGFAIERYNLGSAPQAFVDEPAIAGFLDAFGVEKLPATVVDGMIVISGRYPDDSEFAKWLAVGEQDDKPCCRPGSTCC